MSKQLGVERMMERMQECQRALHDTVEQMLPERLLWQAYFMDLF
jgi:hypothetical protein